MKVSVIIPVYNERSTLEPAVRAVLAVNEADEIVSLVHECMEQVAKLSVPLDADVKVGHSWYETK